VTLHTHVAENFHYDGGTSGPIKHAQTGREDPHRHYPKFFKSFVPEFISVCSLKFLLPNKQFVLKSKVQVVCTILIFIVHKNSNLMSDLIKYW
jgi:hypothetical protein